MAEAQLHFRIVDNAADPSKTKDTNIGSWTASFITPPKHVEMPFKNVLSGLVEGNYRLFDNKSKSYIWINPENGCVEVTPDASSATYFEVKLATGFSSSVPEMFISHFGENGVRRYLSYYWDGSQYVAVLSTMAFSWTPRAQDASQYARLSLNWSTYFQLTVQRSKVVQVYDNGNNHQDWSLVA